MQQRYDLRQEADNTWTVFDVFTGLPVLVDERCLIGLDLDDADDAVDLLNLADRRRRDEE